MSKYIVKCVFNGTSIILNLPGNSEHSVISKAKRFFKGTTKPSGFLVFKRIKPSVLHYAEVNRG